MIKNNNGPYKMRNSTSETYDSNGSLSRYSAEEMDEQRHQNMAYEYLCHLEEAKK
jgi:hypothetical protein